MRKTARKIMLIVMSVCFFSIAHAEENCVHSQGYWKNHESLWPIDELTLGDTLYSQNQLLDILNISPEGDASYIVAHQLIATKLNVAAGADGALVESVIIAADQWLVLYPLGSNPEDTAREEGIALEIILDSYNNGLLISGPPHCNEEEPTVAPSPTSFVTHTPTTTPTRTPTHTPTAKIFLYLGLR